MAVRYSSIGAGVLAVAGLAAAGWIPSALGQPERQPGQGQPGGPPPGQRPGRGEQPGGPGGEGRAPSVEGAMKRIERTMEALKLNIGDASKKEENLQAIWQIEASVVNAKRGKLEHVKGDPAKAQAEFRRFQMEFMRKVLDMEQAVMDGKSEDAKAAFAKLNEIRDAGHKALGVQDDAVKLGF